MTHEQEALVARLEGTPLYESHGEESSLPEMAAATIRALAAEGDRLEVACFNQGVQISQMTHTIREQTAEIERLDRAAAKEGAAS